MLHQFYAIMTKSYSFFLILFFALFFKDLSAQSLVGTQGNYAGSSALSNNPAFINTSNVYFDVAVANAGLSLYNDYAYIKGSDMFSFLFSRDHVFPTYNVDGVNYNFLTYSNEDNKPNNIYESLDADVLRLMYNIDGKQSLAFSIKARVYTSGTNIPSEIPEIIVKGLEDDNFNGHYMSSNTSISTMEWAEFALAYSRKLYDRYQNRVDVGLNVKYLMGYSAAAGNINDLDYDIFNEDSIVVNRFNADLAYSLPINYSADFASSSVFDNSLVRGKGFAFDIGFSYARKKAGYSDDRRMLAPCMQPKLNYLWKLGVSLMDVGFIRFENNAVDNSLDSDDKTLFDIGIFNDVESFDDMMKFLSATYYDGDTMASLVADNFSVGLPTTLRLQFDYNIKDHFYLNATFVQPLKLMKYSVEASPRLMVEPRYETEYFEFSVPLTLYDYRFLNLGASVRIGYVTIGTQNIASYFGIGNVKGLDVYVSLKFNLVKGGCYDRFGACWSSNFGNKKYRR